MIGFIYLGPLLEFNSIVMLFSGQESSLGIPASDVPYVSN